MLEPESRDQLAAARIGPGRAGDPHNREWIGVLETPRVTRNWWHEPFGSVADLGALVDARLCFRREDFA